MAYFKFLITKTFYFFRSLFYRIPKKVLIFIIIALLYFIMIIILPTSEVSAFSIQDGETTVDFGDIDSEIEGKDYIISKINYNNMYWIHYANSISNVVTVHGNYIRVTYSQDVNCYRLMNGQITKLTGPNTHDFYLSSPGSYDHLLFQTTQTFIDSNDNIIFASNIVQEPTAPYFVNWDEIETGNFENIIINTADYSIYDSNMYLSFKQYEPVVVSNETYYSPYKEKRLVLNNSEYCNVTRADGTSTIFSIPLSLFYALKENYKYDISLHVDGEELLYNVFICPALSDEEKAKQEKELQNATQQRIDNGVSNIDSFLNDDKTDTSTITDNMPSAPDLENPTENGFNNIFDTLRSAFTGQNYRDLEFEIPFTNGKKITIPSNLTEQHVPTTIVVLIRMVYWFFISRFIVKDIAGYVEKAKSGDIFDSKESNIKTDML